MILTRRRALLTAGAGLLVPATPAIVRAQLWQPAVGVRTPGAAAAAWTLKAHTFVPGGSATTITTPAIDTTGADFIVLGWFGLGPTTVTATDNKGNSPYTLSNDFSANGNQQIKTFRFRSPTVGSGHTFTATGGANMFCFFGVAAFAGPSAATPLDSTPTNAGGTGTGGITQTPGSLTPTQVNDLLISVFGGYNVGSLDMVITAVDNSFTIIDSQIQGSSWAGAMAWLSYGSTSAVNPQWTCTATTGTTSAIASLVAYKHA